MLSSMAIEAATAAGWVFGTVDRAGTQLICLVAAAKPGD